MNSGRLAVSRFQAFLIAALAILFAGAALRAEDKGAHLRYSTVRIMLQTPDALARLAGLGISLEGSIRRGSASLDLILDATEISKLQNAGFALQILVPDWRADYAARASADVHLSATLSRARGFRLGAMGGFLTLREIESQIDSMRILYPKLVGPRDSIGRSCEGRTIWGVRISAVPSSDHTTPCVLFTALHHAREPEGMMTVMYFLWYMLEQYGSRADVTSILDTRELYIVPVINPDGYAYNAADAPSGGGLWRKNRRANGDGSYGVDLNRNYAFKWGADDIGSSATKDDDTYRGASAFSEPETQAIRDLCIRKKPVCTLNYHSYGNDLVQPWGYLDSPPPDSLIYWRLEDQLTASNYFVYGTGNATLGYTTNGDSDDWMYGDTLAKPRNFALTPEVGGPDDGFWPLPSRILPLADASLEANILFAQSATPHFMIARGWKDPVFTGNAGTFALRLVNVGVVGAHTPATVTFSGDGVDVVSPQGSSFMLGETTAVSLVLNRWASAASGQKATIHVLCNFDGGRSEDSVSFLLGDPAVLFSDSANKASALWAAASTGSLTTWGYTTRTSYEGSGCYADSPWGEYSSNYSSTFTLKRLLPLFGAAAEVRFMARWDIEPEYDFCLVEASTDTGRTWSSLPGRFTRTASGASGGKQLPGTWGYDRTRSTWVEERIGLGSLLGTQAMLRFRFESDGYTGGDGFFFDDIQVLLYPTSRSEQVKVEVPLHTALRQNYPNPFNPATVISYELAENARLKLEVYDILGRRVAVLVDEQMGPGRHTVEFDARELPSGVYICRMMTVSHIATIKMLLLR
jgi:carboxypeptidase T